MGKRKNTISTGQYYHIFNRSIAKYVVFNSPEEFERMLELLTLLKYSDFKYKYSAFKELQTINQKQIVEDLEKNSGALVDIVCFCLMPTHVHLLLRENESDGISKFMAKLLNSYARYFNTTHHRIGPLWSGRFKNVLVESDEQLLHLSRYIHLNATSAGLVKNPLDWPYSSLNEYLDQNAAGSICRFQNVIDLVPEYKKFVLDAKDYQRTISLLKYQLIDDYTG